MTTLIVILLTNSIKPSDNKQNGGVGETRTRVQITQEVASTSLVRTQIH